MSGQDGLDPAHVPVGEGLPELTLGTMPAYTSFLNNLGITPKESEVLRHVQEHLSNAQIAALMHVSERTVESHVSSLLRKSQAANRRELARLTSSLLTDGVRGAGRTNLPTQTASFVARAREVDEVAGLLRSQRFVSLIGPAGVGKTRLASRVAQLFVDDKPDGVWFVDLAPVLDDTAVADQVLIALGGQQVPSRAAIDSLVAQTRGQHLFLLLDNCEHLLAGSAAVAQALVGAGDSTVVLLTSREPLDAPGEVVYRIHPLGVPHAGASTVGEVEESDSFKLLADRARAAGAQLTLVDENAASIGDLCRRLDGLPLAIELVAPRLRTFPPDQIVELLDDRFALLARGALGRPVRHQTLWNAIEWSYNLLDDTERPLFERLAVFPGSFTLDAVAEVCADASNSDVNISDTLSRLVDRSVVILDLSPAGHRYRLLDSLRSFAEEQLPEDFASSLSSRHCAYFVSLAQHAEQQLRGPEAQAWIGRLSAEQDNFARALAWSIRSAPADALRLVSALQPYWEAADLRRSAIDWAERALAAGQDAPPRLRVPALVATTSLVQPWDQNRARQHIDEAGQLADHLADPEWSARVGLQRGRIEAYDGASELAADSLARAAAHFESTGDLWHTARSLSFLSYVKEPEDAIAVLGEARRLFSLTGDRVGIANSVCLMAGVVAGELDDPARAASLSREAITLATEAGSDHEKFHGMSTLAQCYFVQGGDQQATELALECLAAFRKLADHRCEASTLLLLARIARRELDNDRAQTFALQVLDVPRVAASTQTVRDALDLIDITSRTGSPTDP